MADIEKKIAVVLGVVALLFVSYHVISDITGAALWSNAEYDNCRDTDPDDFLGLQGEVTTTRVYVLDERENPFGKTDICLGGHRVEQYSCGDGGQIIHTAQYCPRPTVCREGACV